MDLFLEPVFPSAEMARLFEAVATGIAARSTVTGLTGLKWNGGPEKVALVDRRRVVVGTGERMVALAGACEGRSGGVLVDEEHSVFVEWIPRMPRVIIFGAGHIGAAIARVAADAGFHVVITDDREDFANKDRVPEAHEIVVGDFNSVLDDLTIDEDDYILATTRGHSYDANIIQRTAGSRARYVGMLGSKRKRFVIWKVLAGDGSAGARQVAHRSGDRSRYARRNRRVGGGRPNSNAPPSGVGRVIPLENRWESFRAFPRPHPHE